MIPWRGVGRGGRAVSAFVLACALAAASARAEPLKAGPQGDPAPDSTGRFRQQEWRVPFGADGGGPLLQALVLFPNGPAPHPLAIISHGSPRNAGGKIGRSLYPSSSRWFAERGFAVVTLSRRGHGDSEGWRAEDYGSCRSPSYPQAIDASADDIEAGVRYMRTQPFVDGRRVLLVGQSAGGAGSMAAAARNPEGVVAVLNFAGGRGSRADGEVCDADALVKAMSGFGATVRVPTLWVYAENDQYFAPALARTMFDSFKARGGTGVFLPMPPFDRDGHRLFGYGVRIWGPPVGDFLNGVPDLKPGR
jgi:dienelactone hydrolase